MRWFVEGTLDNFDFWGEAKNVKNIVKEYDEKNGTSFWASIVFDAEEIFTDEAEYSDVNVNDWLAFDVPNYEEYSEIFGD